MPVAWSEVGTLVTFVSWPLPVPVTFTEISHCDWARRVAPDSEIDWPPAVTVPPHPLLSPLGVLTLRPCGRLSVKPTPVSVVLVLKFPSSKVTEVDPPEGIQLFAKVLVNPGGMSAADAGTAASANQSIDRIAANGVLGVGGISLCI